MCSIAGIINFATQASAVKTIELMNKAQYHRGPDSQGIYQSDRAILGHCRLAIIDPASGAQPMLSADKSIVVVLNGEIYNFKALRIDLESKGYVFQTSCDTEVLLYLYAEYGRDMVAMLSGMFAFAIWDTKREQLLMGRDRLGQKPLVYFRDNGLMVFSSELAALKCHPQFPTQLDTQAVSDYLSFMYTPANTSVYKNVEKLAPGHSLLFYTKKNTIDIAPYWSLDFSKKQNLSHSEAVEQCKNLVNQAVSSRLMSDVPSGTFLSGGLDSAIITALTTAMNREQGARTSCFTLGFSNPKYDERTDAIIAADFINRQNNGYLDHHIKEVTPSDFTLVEKLVSHYGEPFADASMLPTALLSEFAAGSIKMALSGDGADEVFAGYERYIVMSYCKRLNMIPASLRKIFFKTMSNLLPDSGERSKSGRLRRLFNVISQSQNQQYFSILDRCPVTLQKQLFGEKLRQNNEQCSRHIYDELTLSAKDMVEKAMELDIHTYLSGDTLPKMDIASMAYSLEVRSPFLDHNLVEFAASLPLKYKLNGSSRKDILKRAFASDIPPSTIAARKRGFGVPVANWLRGCWQSQAREILFDSDLTRDNWINRKGLESIWQEHQSGHRDHSYPLWGLLMLALFLESKK